MKRFKSILFLADQELDDTDSFQRIVSFAQSNGAQLTVVSTLESVPTGYSSIIKSISPAEIEKILTDSLFRQLENLTATARKTIQIKIKVLTGQPFLKLIQEVLRNKMDLVVKTAENRGIADRFFGSTDLHLLRKCPCPVLLMKSTKKGKFKKILAAVDFEPHGNNETENALNQQILQMSTSLALSEACELHIIHVWSAYAESSLRSGFAKQPKNEVDDYVNEIHTEHKDVLENLMKEFGGKTEREAVEYLKPKIHLLKGSAETIIPNVVKENQIDLVIMGTVGRTGIPGLMMGNTAETILSQIDCSVFAIKPEGFVTPISL